jgi:hypothetical protein
MFANDSVQNKIDELSRSARSPTDESINDVVSRMATQFVLHDGVFTYRKLSFNVQGASVQLEARTRFARRHSICRESCC